MSEDWNNRVANLKRLDGHQIVLTGDVVENEIWALEGLQKDKNLNFNLIRRNQGVSRLFNETYFTLRLVRGNMVAFESVKYPGYFIGINYQNIMGRHGVILKKYDGSLPVQVRVPSHNWALFEVWGSDDLGSVSLKSVLQGNRWLEHNARSAKLLGINHDGSTTPPRWKGTVFAFRPRNPSKL